MVKVISNATRPPEPVDQVAASRIDELTQKRDDGIAQGVSHTFADDGRTGTVPMDVPNSATKVGVLYARAQRVIAAGNAKTFSITTLEGQDHDLSETEMAEVGDKAADKGQEWHVQWQKHRNAILSIAGDGSLTDDEKHQQIQDYDDDNSNGGWPS